MEPTTTQGCTLRVNKLRFLSILFLAVLTLAMAGCSESTPQTTPEERQKFSGASDNESEAGKGGQPNNGGPADSIGESTADAK